MSTCQGQEIFYASLSLVFSLEYLLLELDFAQETLLWSSKVVEQGL